MLVPVEKLILSRKPKFHNTQTTIIVVQNAFQHIFSGSDNISQTVMNFK